VSNVEATHPTASSLGTWGSICQLFMSHVMGGGSSETSATSIFTCETQLHPPAGYYSLQQEGVLP